MNILIGSRIFDEGLIGGGIYRTKKLGRREIKRGRIKGRERQGGGRDRAQGETGRRNQGGGPELLISI